MKLRIADLTWVAMGALAFGATLFAQSVPEQFVVSGKAAEKIQDFTTINLATAERIAGVCEKAAAAEGVQVTVMILDNDGNHVYMDRMDGQNYLNIITADMKARTALMDRLPSKLRMNRVIEDPTIELQQMQLGLFANSGGLPILVNKQLIGTIGVGGSAPRPPVWSDEICGRRALVDVFGPTVPELVKDLPPRQNPNPGNAPVPKFAATAPTKSSLPAEFVVGGKGAGNVFDGYQISLAAAQKIGRGCREWVTAKGQTMSMYILDNAGEFVHVERMDGQVYNNIRTALLKAQTALKTRQPTSIAAAQMKNNPAGIPRFAVYFNLYEVEGGIPIVVDGQMIGSVGVGGIGGGGDEGCAIAGLKAAFGDHVAVPVYPAGK